MYHQSSLRHGISERTRFEIFKRDNFTCCYCGKNPPEATLELEHVLALAHGGTNNPKNLVTSCKKCNRGKSSVPLTDKSTARQPESVAEKEVDRWLSRDPHSYQRQLVVDRHLERILSGEQARAAAEVTRILDHNLAEAMKRRQGK